MSRSHLTSDLIPGGSTKAMRNREERSTRVTIADLFAFPMMRSPSQWPASSRVAIWAGRSPIFRASVMYWRGFNLVRDRGRRLYFPERNSRARRGGTNTQAVNCAVDRFVSQMSVEFAWKPFL